MYGPIDFCTTLDGVLMKLINGLFSVTSQNSYFLPLFCPDELSKGKRLSRDVETSPSAGRNSMFPEVKEKIGAASLSRNEVFEHE